MISGIIETGQQATTASSGTRVALVKLLQNNSHIKLMTAYCDAQGFTHLFLFLFIFVNYLVYFILKETIFYRLI
jgi:hypothetical protein